MTDSSPWERFQRHYLRPDGLGLGLDISRMGFTDQFFESVESMMRRAFEEMTQLESGAIANPDEGRMVGHYWLRAPHLSPTDDMRIAIERTFADIDSFVADVHSGKVLNEKGQPFDCLLLVGIGGSALGPQFVTEALGGPGDAMQAYFCDNTDPDGIDRTLDRIGGRLESTLVVVVSKSGGTKETRNAMVEVRDRFEAKGLNFARHAIAVTCPGSVLDRLADSQEWLRRFEMWDWVGGRTSEFSAVGMLPAALQGFDISAMRAGAADCDAATRIHETLVNPAALLALMWYHAGDGCGDRHMVVLPYKDRLQLLGRYLQQLVMESLGKRQDRDGRTVNQGLTVYGNKGSTDQHAFVQQLRDGRNDFFVAFIQVLRDRASASRDIEPGATSGDFLHGLLLGTRDALNEAGRPSLTITLDDVSPRSIGVLIALFERAVGFYASLINVNAYNQPGVEAGKKAADRVLTLQRSVTDAMRREQSVFRTADEWARTVGQPDHAETVFKILEHLAANSSRGVSCERSGRVREFRFAMI